MSRTPPTSEELLAYARQLAGELHAIDPPEAELRARIEYVMWGRKQGWTCVEDGSMTEVELRQLLLDHLDYECAHVSGHGWNELDGSARQGFVERLDQLLFGRPARG